MSGQPGKTAADEQAEQRTALLRRVAVAGGMIAMLIGALAVFDASRRPKEAVPAPQAKPEVQVPVPAAVAEAPPLPPAEETPAGASPVNLQESPPPLPEGTALPDKADTTQMPEKPGKADKPDVAAPVPAPAAAPASRAAPPAAGRLVIGHEAPAPAAPVPAISRAPVPQPTGPVQGYVVQVGVFSSVANAEEVRARLALNGIPSQIEARVHVGPFRSRAEADAARARLRAIGMDSAAPTPLRSPSARP